MNSDIDIDYSEGTAQFTIKATSETNGETYSGRFKVKCYLNPLEYIRADSKYRELIGNSNPIYTDKHAGRLAFAISQLKYRVVTAPNWWENPEGDDGGHLDDALLLGILTISTDAENQYREGIKRQAEEARNGLRKAIDEEELVRPDNSPPVPQNEAEGSEQPFWDEDVESSQSEE